jgi:hypothetical protein
MMTPERHALNGGNNGNNLKSNSDVAKAETYGKGKEEACTPFPALRLRTYSSSLVAFVTTKS